uniref:NADH dehydrogenase subunit 3 n=1 Tax=Elthusa poutassouiensis TaxID=3104314 RepID=UPI002E79947C|nr:NADH dehydrogenase subunit 3 [Elthusa poutassouiensis]WPS93546.1 NADH dehydrogenase subunit 3 [Elthusa poutassouiensis]
MVLTQILLFSIIMISTLILCLAFILSKKNLQEWEKNSQFECGFNPLSNLRITFSMKFFLITIIFLIFDIEIALLLPSMMAISETYSIVWMSLLSFFTTLLIFGIFYEWKDKALEWK